MTDFESPCDGPYPEPPEGGWPLAALPVKRDKWRVGDWAKVSCGISPDILDPDHIYVVESIHVCNVRRFGGGLPVCLKLRDFNDFTKYHWFRATCFDNVTPI